jgi:hypothetical protein
MREKRRKKKSKTKKYQNSKKTTTIPLSSPYEANALSMCICFHGHQKTTMHLLKKDVTGNSATKKIFLTAQPSKIKGTALGHEAHVLDPLPV